MGRRKWGAAFLAAILLASFYVAATKPTVKASSLLAVEPPEGSIVVPDDFSTINEAIEYASEGGTVFVKKGTYDENVFVDETVALIGEDRQETIIRGVYERYGPWPVILVTADNVTISGFTITGARLGIMIEDTWSHIPSGCKIIGNNIIDNSGHGIITRTGENYVISGNNITGNGYYGISTNSFNSVISGNNISGNCRNGILVDSGSNVTITGNSITGNGVDIDAESTYRGGLDLSGDGPLYVYGNNITDNQGYGIQFAQSCNNSTVYQNNIARNSIGVNLLNFGVYGDSSIGLGNIVYRNNFVDNLQQASVDQEWDSSGVFPEYSTGTDVVMWDNGKEGNYWSDYQTRYPDAKEKGSSGIGDIPYVIDENNTDHYPLMTPVAVSSTPPPTSEPSSYSLPTIAAFAAAAVTVFVVVVLAYRTHRKSKQT